jgi:hypothetical protein
MPPVSKSAMRNFLQALAAVLAGNAVYYLLMPHLPEKARHIPFRTDMGVFIDLWFCLVAYGLVRAIWRDRSGPRTHP